MGMVSPFAAEAVQRLAARSLAQTEADLQSDVQTLLVTGGFDLDASQVVRLESPTGDGTRRRIDVEVGSCIFELKKDLRAERARARAEEQLAGYVQQREEELGTRVAGVLTDGTVWRLYRLKSDELYFVTELTLSETDPDVERLIAWLDSVLAVRDRVAPTPQTIHEMLGAESPAHKFDHAVLRSMLEDASSNSEVRLKKNLWAKLLRTAFGDAFSDDDSLFVNHTLLVVTAEAIAHEIIGFDLESDWLAPEDIVTGSRFSESGVHGVVEEDFFDWVLQVTGAASSSAQSCAA